MTAPHGNVRVVMTIPTEVYDRLYAQSQAQGVPMATIYRRALLNQLMRDEITEHGVTEEAAE